MKADRVRALINEITMHICETYKLTNPKVGQESVKEIVNAHWIRFLKSESGSSEESYKEKTETGDYKDVCRKCNSHGSSMLVSHSLLYDSIKDLLIKTCYRCRHKWSIKPKDHKDET